MEPLPADELTTAEPSERPDQLAPLTATGLVDRSSFWMPEHLCESAWLTHAPFMFWLIGRHRPQVFVELGTHQGFSYLATCQAVERHGTGTTCFAIDTWQGDEHAGFYGEEVLRELRASHDRRYATFSSLVQGTFDDSLSYFADASIDLLHLDGRHFYEDVRHDIETWLPKMSSRGLLVLHDTNVREREFGIARFLAEARHEHRAFEFTHGHGLAVLQVGTHVPDELDALLTLEQTPDLANVLRSVYARLGEGVEHAWRRTAAERSVSDQSRHAEELGAALAERSTAVSQLEAALAERSTAVSQLEAALAERSTAVSQLEAALARAALPRYPSLPGVLRHPGSLAWAVRRLIRTQRERRLLLASPEFDGAWYRDTYQDVRETGADPAMHYLRYGAREGRDPSPTFSTLGYLLARPDVAESGMNPLVHYLRSGTRMDEAP